MTVVRPHRHAFELRLSHGLQQRPRHVLLADTDVSVRAVFLPSFHRLHHAAQSFGGDPNGVIGEGVEGADL